MLRQDQVSASLLKRQGLLVFALAILICLTRRPNQLLSAGVWVEEGALFIPQFLKNGLGFLFDPVNGYVIVPSKIVALLSYLVSFQYYPEVSLFFTLIFSGLVSLAILKSPTVIKHKPLAALAPFLVPSDPEVIAVGEYIFWHTSLCAALSALWCANAGAQRFRNLLVVIGGLSSPFIVALLPVFFFRTLFYRTKAESSRLQPRP